MMSADQAMDLLKRAEEVIRQRTRSARYWAGGDQFAVLFPGKALRPEARIGQAACVNLPAVLDSLYEELCARRDVDLSAPAALTADLQAMTELAGATAWLQRVPSGEWTLVEAAKALLAVLTSQGHAALAKATSAAVATEWIALWQDCVRRHNVQQQRTNALVLLGGTEPSLQAPARLQLGLEPQDLRPSATSFSEGVREYLVRNADSGAGALALSGTLPFTTTLAGDALEGLFRAVADRAGFLDPLAQLLRMAQDVRFDPTEAFNAAVVGMAAERRVGFLEVRAGGLPAAELEPRLQEEWKRRSAESRATLDATAARANGKPWHAALQEILSGVYRVTDLISGVAR